MRPVLTLPPNSVTMDPMDAGNLSEEEPSRRGKQASIVLLPGLDGTEILFQPFLNAVPAGVQARVIAYPPDVPLGYADLVDRVRAALPEAGPFLLLGWSFSGPVALRVAAARPRGLAGVILCASFVRKPVRLVPAWARFLVCPVMFRAVPAFLQVRVLLGDHATLPVRQLLAAANARVQARVLAARVRELLKVSVVAKLRTCPVPVLYLSASRDRVVRRQPSKLPLRRAVRFRDLQRRFDLNG